MKPSLTLENKKKVNMILNKINRTRASSRNSKITDSMIPLWLKPAVSKTFGLRIPLHWLCGLYLLIFVVVETKTEEYSVLFWKKYMGDIWS